MEATLYQCVKCKGQFPAFAFYKHKGHKNGIGSYCKPCGRLISRAWAHKQPVNTDKNRNKAYLFKYGLTLEEYNALLDAQEGLCAICKEPQANRPLVIDHNHITNRVRALLCIGCNSGIGCFKEDPATLFKAIAYLQTHN